MVAVKGDAIGPLDASGTTAPFTGNVLDSVRHEIYLAARGGGLGGKGGIIEGLVPSIVSGQMQLSFSAGSAFAPERDASSNPLARGYDVWNDAASVVQFTAAHATLGRIDTVVAAAVDGEDGAVGSGALAIGYHLAAVPGTAAGSPTTPTDANITSFLGRGGWTRLYDCTIPAASTQLSLVNCAFRGNRLNTWNLFDDIPFTLTAATGWSINTARYRFDNLAKRVDLELSINKTTSSTAATNSGGNWSPDIDMTTNWPSALMPASDALLNMQRLGVINYWGRIDVGSTRLILTHANNESETITSGTTVRIYGHYYLDT